MTISDRKSRLGKTVISSAIKSASDVRNQGYVTCNHCVKRVAVIRVT